MDWSIEIEAESDRPLDEDLADQVLETLAAHGPALALGSDHLSVRFDVEAVDEREAFERGVQAFRSALPELKPVRVEVQSVDELERRLAESNAPELLGIAEVAEALGVSRQRVYEIAELEDFPVPIVRLKAGPVWQRSALARFMSSWRRQAGRPRKRTEKSV